MATHALSACIAAPPGCGFRGACPSIICMRIVPTGTRKRFRMDFNESGGKSKNRCASKNDIQVLACSAGCNLLMRAYLRYASLKSTQPRPFDARCLAILTARSTQNLAKRSSSYNPHPPFPFQTQAVKTRMRASCIALIAGSALASAAHESADGGARRLQFSETASPSATLSTGASPSVAPSPSVLPYWFLGNPYESCNRWVGLCCVYSLC